MVSLVKKYLAVLITIIVIFLTHSISVHAQQQPIYFFYGDGCPHCTNVEKYFNDNNIYNNYPVKKLEIYFNRENAQLYNNILDNLNIPMNKRGVPTLVVGEKVLVGDSPIIENFEENAASYKGKKLVENITTTPTPTPTQYQQTQTSTNTNIKSESNNTNLTFFAVILASVVDAINPCAFAVLILLMSTILLSGNKNKALKSGLSFATAIFISYFLMGLGLYKTLQVTNASRLFFNIVGWLAIILGIFNLKDALWYGKGFLMEVPLNWRPRLKKVIASVTSPIGAFLIGFIVSLFLLPCTSGPYIVILGMLAEKTTQAQAMFYLFVYNLVFVSPMVLITLAVYKGFSVKKAEQIRSKNLRVLHLIAGIILILMGIAVLSGVF